MENYEGNNQKCFRKTLFYGITSIVLAIIYVICSIKQLCSPVVTSFLGIFALAFPFLAVKFYWETGETTVVILFVVNHEQKKITGIETTVDVAVETVNKYKEQEKPDIDYLGEKSFKKFIEDYNEKYSYEIIDSFETFSCLLTNRN